MEFIYKKLLSLAMSEEWDYGNGFTVSRSKTGWSIFKQGIHVVTSLNIGKIGKEIKLTFIAMEVTKTF